MRLRRRIAGLGMSEQKAIIDIGSNTVRLVVYDGPPRAPLVVWNEKVTARLGRGVAENGLLSDKAQKQALAALARFAALLKLMKLRDVQAVATAAVRDAANGAEFLARVAETGLKPRLLSGEEEAVISAQGVMAAFPGARGVVGDLGGGSLELTDIDGNSFTHGASLPLGTLRLSQLRAAGAAKFAGRVRKELAAADWSGGHAQPFYLVGGSWRALARYAIHQSGWPIDDTHGFELAPQAALTLARTVGQGKMVPVPGLSGSRAASLPDAAALLGVLVREFGPSKLVFSSWGLREGLLFPARERAAQSQDPLLAGISGFAEGMGAQPTTAAMLAGWTAPANTAEEPGRERLRLAAAMLALAAGRIEPNLRVQTVQEWALGKRWIGIDAQGRAMLAAAGLANAGRPVLPEALSRLASPEALREAVGWGLAVRLCRRFSAAAPQSLSNSALARQDGQLVLTVREPIHALCNELVEKDLRNLAEWLGDEPVITLSL